MKGLELIHELSNEKPAKAELFVRVYEKGTTKYYRLHNSGFYAGEYVLACHEEVRRCDVCNKLHPSDVDCSPE